MEIDVDKTKNVFIRIAIVLSVVVTVWLSRSIWLSWFENEPENHAPWAAVQIAAEDFAVAFYTVDFRDQLAWQQSLEATCSEMGRGLMLQVMPQAWQLIAKARTISTVKDVEVGEPVSVGQTPVGGIPYVVLPVSVETDVPWPDGNDSFSFYAVMELVENTEEHGEIWKFQMFMSEEDVANLQG